MSANLAIDPPATCLRFVALGDSATCGLGDRVGGHLRGWSRILVSALEEGYDVSYLNLAVPGSTIEKVWAHQAPEAVCHHPHLVSLIVGLNDAFRSDWDADIARQHLRETAGRLHENGALLLTACFHDHTKVFGLPRLLGRPLSRRIEQLNEIFLEIHHDFDTVHVDLGAEPTVYLRNAWSIDRLHPSEVGHRLLALQFARGLRERGVSVADPGLDQNGDVLPRGQELAHLLSTGIPWLYRRARDWMPHLVLNAVPARRATSA